MAVELSVNLNNISPFVRYAHEIEFNSTFALKNRSLYDNEFIFGIEGEASITLLEEEYRIKAGDLLHIKPHVEHSMQIFQGNSFRCICVHFDWIDIGKEYDFSPYTVYMKRSIENNPILTESELSTRPVDQFMDFEFPTHLHVADSTLTLTAFRDIIHFFENTHISAKLHMKAAFLQIMAYVSQEVTTSEGVTVSHPNVALVLQSIQYMREHYAERISHSAMAAMHRLTPKYFGTLFKRVTGRTITDYLLKIRMERAKELLKASSYSIQEIAAITGIHDVYYFSKLFKNTEGISPGRYRKSMNSLFSSLLLP